MSLILRLLRALLGAPTEAQYAAASPGAASQVGRCGHRMPSVLVTQRWHDCCSLPAGHAGWHRDSTSRAEWSA